jgi:hypothetical protein
MMTPQQKLRHARLVLAHLTPANHPASITVRVYKTSISQLLAADPKLKNDNLWSWRYDEHIRVLHIIFAT